MQALLTVPIICGPVLVAWWAAERPGRADRAERRR